MRTYNFIGFCLHNIGFGKSADLSKQRSVLLSACSSLVALVLAFGPEANAGTETRFTVVDSSPTSWVAWGFSDYTITPDLGWTFTPSRNRDNGIDIEMDGPAMPGTVVTSWDLNFSAPFDALITPGLYENFQRWPFQDADRPGLSFTSTGRGVNQASGFFEVFEATYGPGGEVLTFSADFTHYAEENLDNWAIVEIRYNIPEPGSLALALVGLVGVGCHRRANHRMANRSSAQTN